MNAKISGSRYVLAVQNLQKSIEFYTQLLGFHPLWEDEGWYFLVRDSCQIMLGEYPDDVPAFDTGCHSYFAYLEVENIENLYQELQSKDIKTLGKIEDKPWTMREFSIETIDGHRMMFGTEI